MELIKLEQEKKYKPVNTYEVVIKFMEGDADGYQYHTIAFGEDRLNDSEFKNELEEFLRCITDCIKQDDKGRGGFDTVHEMISEYGGINNWSKFCIDARDEQEIDEDDLEDFIDSGALIPLTKTKLFTYNLPTEGKSGYFASYDLLQVFYYDNNGDKFHVQVKF